MSELVSIIIPYVKKDEHFERMQELLRAQTWKNLEILFCEDRDRKGPSWARNCGLNKATGNIILFADVDDFVSPTWVEKMVSGLGNSDFAWSGFSLENNGKEEIYNPNEMMISHPKIVSYFFKRVFGYRLRDLFKIFLPGGLWQNCHREWAGVWRLALRREKFLNIRFDESLRLYEDAMFISEIAKMATSVSIIPNAGYKWYVTSNGTMSQGFNKNLLENKFAVRDARRKIDPAMNYWRGTFFLSALQIFRMAGFSAAWRYLRWGK